MLYPPGQNSRTLASPRLPNNHMQTHTHTHTHTRTHTYTMRGEHKIACTPCNITMEAPIGASVPGGRQGRHRHCQDHGPPHTTKSDTQTPPRGGGACANSDSRAHTWDTRRATRWPAALPRWPIDTAPPAQNIRAHPTLPPPTLTNTHRPTTPTKARHTGTATPRRHGGRHTYCGQPIHTRRIWSS
jgi:hypothetical protein